MLSDAQLLKIANNACPGHDHELQAIVFKKGVFSGTEYVEGSGLGTYGEAQFKCLVPKQGIVLKVKR